MRLQPPLIALDTIIQAGFLNGLLDRHEQPAKHWRYKPHTIDQVRWRAELGEWEYHLTCSEDGLIWGWEKESTLIAKHLHEETK